MMTLFADVFITGLSNASVTEVRDVLMATFATTDLGDVPLVMGVEVKRNMEPGTIELDQGKYTRSVIERFEMSDCNPVYTTCLLYTSPSPRDQRGSRMPSSA